MRSTRREPQSDQLSVKTKVGFGGGERGGFEYMRERELQV